MIFAALSGFVPLAFIGGIGYTELIVIGAVALIIFGSRLPQVGRSLGRGIMEFKKGLRGIEEEIQSGLNEQNESDEPDQPAETDTTQENTSAMNASGTSEKEKSDKEPAGSASKTTTESKDHS